jgi:hypothetical protein
VKFLSKNPFARNDIRIGRAGDKLPGVVRKEGKVLLTHGSSPIRIEKSGLVRFR